MLEQHPEMSDRAIAEECGVGNKTVSRMRAATVSNDTVGKRLGRDGKARRMPSLNEHRRPSYSRALLEQHDVAAAIAERVEMITPRLHDLRSLR
jgi:hypothetical protein